MRSRASSVSVAGLEAEGKTHVGFSALTTVALAELRQRRAKPRRFSRNRAGPEVSDACYQLAGTRLVWRHGEAPDVPDEGEAGFVTTPPSTGSASHPTSVSLPSGLSSDEAHRRLKKLGPNAMPDTSEHPLRMALEKFWAPVPWMLEAAIVLELVLGKYIEAAIIAGC